MDVGPRKIALMFQNTIRQEESAILQLTLEGNRASRPYPNMPFARIKARRFYRAFWGLAGIHAGISRFLETGPWGLVTLGLCSDSWGNSQLGGCRWASLYGRFGHL